MIDLPYMPKSKRRLTRGCGCLSAIVLAPMAFGLVHIAWIKIAPFTPVVVGLLAGITGLYIWLSRQR